MKYCPVCGERYEEEIIRFCTKDGTPLIDEEGPKFTTMPSEDIHDADDAGEETVIRRNPLASSEIPPDARETERIVIPTTPDREAPVRARTPPAYYAPPVQKSNTFKTVLLTVFGTLAVLAIGAILFKLFQKESAGNLNTNINVNLANQNTNLNTNGGFDSNFNFNMNSSIPSNLNTNLKTPSPTPSPRPSPSASATASVTPSPSASPTPRPSPRPTGTAKPATSPTPRATPKPTDGTATNKASGLPIH